MNAVLEKHENPFASAPVAARPTQNAIGDSDQQRAIAEVQAAMVIAKRFPRDPIAAVDRILTACTRPTLAEQALYSYSRGGSDITGPSIRLAEALAQSWGNVQFGIRELDQRNGESTVEAFAWDIETNTRQVKVFQVPHIRYTRKGTVRLEDPRDIYEMTANQGARRLRACILGVIPGDVIEAAQKQCEKTLHTKIEITDEFISGMLENFSQYDVTKEMIEKRIQRRIDALTPALAVQLRKIYNSLRDGMSSIGDWFEIEAPGEPETSKADAVKEKLRARKEAKPAPETKKDAVSTVTQTITFAQVADALQKARSQDDLAAAADLIRSVDDETQQVELQQIYEDRSKSLDGA